MNYETLKYNFGPVVSLLNSVPAFTERGENMPCLLKIDSKSWLPAATRDCK